jgi:hypothetical protein
MKTTYECECCEEQYPTARKCRAHEEVCKLADKTAGLVTEKLPSLINRRNIEKVVALLMIAGIVYMAKQCNTPKPMSQEEASVLEGI